MVWYSHLLKNFPQFVVIDTVKGFIIVNKAGVDVFLESRFQGEISITSYADDTTLMAERKEELKSLLIK